ncbi:saccharopine dehydrogenase domain-containing protein [Penicillium riverlandense]|uniref:saccharopine dehydrogenase domain-containing protein n=1 Tax=Penicillium riverlandense TaxID=1903569 RepID=UPI002547D62F|nr:saccharopine dehydrogenase domain-containing protein [Penicillium riverlandense]KAJ5825838.1 saccharopine dehydrogenase domain-containing protein [Penicillium riverlandense]
MSKPIVFIGASGAMCQLVIQRFIKASDAPFTLADINIEAVESLRATLPPGRATTLKLDLFDHEALVNAMKGAALVVLGAGPYTRTSHPVMEACLEVKVPYLDFDDDVESTQAALDMNERAKKAGVAFFIGCGASPGLSNVIAVDAASELDSVSAIDLCWLVGNEKSGAGRAVMEHLMHIASGPCLSWINGKPTLIESYLETRYAPMLGESSEMMLHETAHPEPVTLPRLFPTADSIRCFGGLYPPTKFGCARGLGNAVRRGILPIDEACDFQVKARHGELEPEVGGQLLRDLKAQFHTLEINSEQGSRLLKQAKGSNRAAAYALEGLMDQIRRGETSKEEVRDFLIEASGYTEKVETAGALLVRVVGSRNGHPAIITKRTPTCGSDLYLMRSMGTVTGTSCAAFMVMAMQAGQTLSGVFCPEDWAEPRAFYKALETVGVPRHELPETHTF